MLLCYNHIMAKLDIVAIVEYIVYRNEANGYTVIKIKSQDSNIGTAVGRFPLLMEGERVRLKGECVYNKFGEQLNCESIEILKPNTIDGIKKYLASGLIKGVGPKTAEKIVERFKKDSLDIIEFAYMRLTEISGISERKAREIYESFTQIKDMQNSVMFLQDYGISISLAVKIYDSYKNRTIEIVKNNPYKLVEDIDGIGFRTADKIAKSVGIELDSIFRLRAGLVFTIKESCEKNGNTYLGKNELIVLTARLLDVDLNPNFNKMLEALSGLEMDNLIRILEVDENEIVMLYKYYQIENSLAQIIVKLLVTNQDDNINVDSDIDMFELVSKIKLHQMQKEAVKMAINKGVCVITGGPGTGKTTIIKCILSILNNMNMKVKLLAPTGRASKRLSESTGEDASTIHRALELDFNNGKMGFYYNETNKLRVDAVIVDEVSMVDAQLMNSLLKALNTGTKVVLVGDKDQLPSVGAGNVLADLLACGIVPVTELSKIYRQDNESLIVENAHLINEGKMPIIDNSCKDFFFETKYSPQDIADSILQLVTNRLPNHFKDSEGKIQVLAPLKAGLCGVENLNREMQERINPPSRRKPEIEVGSTIFRLYDKVMQISNNYSMEWERIVDNFHESGMGVFNGDIGTIVSLDRSSREMVVAFEDGRNCVYLSSDLSQLVLSYAITIHKSQGSEFDYVVIPIVSGSPHILTRNLIYTAVTRAKKAVVLVGEKDILHRMIKNNYTAKRNSMLCKFIEQRINDVDGVNFLNRGNKIDLEN